jgi:hypothetical protein
MIRRASSVVMLLLNLLMDDHQSFSELLGTNGMLWCPLFVGRRHASTFFFSETAVQIYFKYGL